MSDAASFDINITMSDAAPGWQPHPTPGHQAHEAHGAHSVPCACSAPSEVPSTDDFDLDIRYGDILGDPPVKSDPLVAGFLSITCSNTCGVTSGCAGSGCGGVTCGNSCNLFSGCATHCGSCGASCGCPPPCSGGGVDVG